MNVGIQQENGQLIVKKPATVQLSSKSVNGPLVTKVDIVVQSNPCLDGYPAGMRTPPGHTHSRARGFTGTCSNMKLAAIVAVVVVLMAAVSAIVGYVIANFISGGMSDSEFTIQNLVYEKTGTTDEWVVIQRRSAGNVNFTRSWADYKKGFGSRSGDFWFGNDNIHELTYKGFNRLRVELELFDGSFNALEYGLFRVGPESDLYRLEVSGYHAGMSSIHLNCLRYHDGKPFSTYDNDNDELDYNCAAFYRGGWWYDSCQEANLNGEYRTGLRYKPGEMIWCYLDKHIGISHSQMMIKRAY